MLISICWITVHIVNLSTDHTVMKAAFSTYHQRNKDHDQSLPFFNFVSAWCASSPIGQHRKGGGGVRDAKAQHRNPQVRLHPVQAEEEGHGERPFVERPLQHPTICGRQ